ncbi:hypothetical protein HDV00_006775 [Rhizophlyctis rosea]|nr:hypothetical protein HDV00_006775 [Rhizophlyctis rosea]
MDGGTLQHPAPNQPFTKEPLHLRRPSPSPASPGRRHQSRPRLPTFDPISTEDLEKHRASFLRLYELAEEPALSGPDSETEDDPPRPASAKRDRAQSLLQMYRSREDEIKATASLALEMLTKLQHAMEARTASEGQIGQLKDELDVARSDLQREMESSREIKAVKLTLTGKVASLETQLRSAETQLSQMSTEMDAKDKQISKLSRNIGKLEPLKETKSHMDHELESINVQLLQARASENSLRRKYKKLSARCVELQAYHDRCKQEHAGMAETEETMRQIRKRESSPILKSRAAFTEATSFSLEPPREVNSPIANGGDSGLLLALVRELSASNTKLKAELAEAKEVSITAAQLKAELLEARELLSERSNELAALSSVVDEHESHYGENEHPAPRLSVFAELESYVSSSLPSQSTLDSQLRRANHQHSGTMTGHNDHYIISKMFQSSQSEPTHEEASWEHSTTASEPALRDSDPSSNTEQSDQPTHRRSRLSRNNSTGSMYASTNEPALIYLRTLHKMGDHLYNRLLGTDTVSLNRKIRRTFDLAELSRLSNNVIENIMADIRELAERFPVQDLEGDKKRSPKKKGGGSGSGGSSALDELVLPLVLLVQSLLHDIATVRMTLNDYALIYYEKMNEKSLVPVDEDSSRPRPGQMSKSRSMGSLRGEEGGSTDNLIAAIIPLFRRKADTPHPPPTVRTEGEGSTSEGSKVRSIGAEGSMMDPDDPLPTSGWMRWMKKSQM